MKINFRNIYCSLLVKSLFFSVILLTFGCAATSKTKIQTDISTLNGADNTKSGPSDADSSNIADLDNNGFDEFSDESFEADDVQYDKKETIYDPFEGFNRAVFKFNDKVYFWILKPVSNGYRNIIPKTVRLAVRRFFSNLGTPGRFVNCILQQKFKAAGIEVSRLVINSTLGVAGFMDPARKFKLYKQDEDFGQTLGFYGIGHGFYLNLPLLGPLTFRDTIGTLGDWMLDPVTYMPPVELTEQAGITVYKRVNETSLNINLYDDLVKKAFDPYVFMKNAYFQIRENQVKE